jgi:hypothetical protein
VLLTKEIVQEQPDTAKLRRKIDFTIYYTRSGSGIVKIEKGEGHLINI